MTAWAARYSSDAIPGSGEWTGIANKKHLIAVGFPVDSGFVLMLLVCLSSFLTFKIAISAQVLINQVKKWRQDHFGGEDRIVFDINAAYFDPTATGQSRVAMTKRAIDVGAPSKKTKAGDVRGLDPEEKRYMANATVRVFSYYINKKNNPQYDPKKDLELVE
ncbi:hypothetical protein L596_017501 [Steinernema carpocapsae]|uniref:Uncharacterized protein n=1 Tax=Steinernema carpocapsae TaxID=34508 RepID=A0A4U5N2L7_STECR|nr:hypothetical protein L596_017501 [Steinernema carpocapsae]